MRILALFALAAAAARAEPKLKVFISADMEGVAGVSTGADVGSGGGTPTGEAKQFMLAEVNAAVAGAFDAGATEVVVADSHADGRNLDPEGLDKRARLVRGLLRPLSMMQGIDDTFAAVVFVGYHAAEGMAGASLSHTFSSSTVAEVKLDGAAVSEADWNAAVAGEYGVPVVFLSGDAAICAEVKAVLSPLETVEVKSATGTQSATMIHPSEAQRLIRAGVKRGVDRRAQLKPYRVAHPVRVEITYKRIPLAEIASWIPGVERPRGNAIAFGVKDMLAAARFFTALDSLGQ
jgi:D-amino peptidase